MISFCVPPRVLSLAIKMKCGNHRAVYSKGQTVPTFKGLIGTPNEMKQAQMYAWTHGHCTDKLEV